MHAAHSAPANYRDPLNGPEWGVIRPEADLSFMATPMAPLQQTGWSVRDDKGGLGLDGGGEG